MAGIFNSSNPGPFAFPQQQQQPAKAGDLNIVATPETDAETLRKVAAGRRRTRSANSILGNGDDGDTLG